MVVKKNSVVIALVVGVVIGVGAALLLPAIVRPYLPRSMRGEDLPGVVRAKQRDGDRLLLTVVTGPGTVLATFTEEVAGIDMLVQVGDSVALEVSDYEPFLSNPELGRVLKGPDMPAQPSPPTLAPPAMRDSLGATSDSVVPPADTTGRDTIPMDTTENSGQ